VVQQISPLENSMPADWKQEQPEVLV